MKLYSNQADNYIKNMKPGKPGAVLIYGPDAGAVRDFQRKITNKITGGADAMGVKEFSAEQVKEDPGALLSEINARSFFATERVIVIDFAASIAETVTEAIAEVPDDLTIIITADELGKDSKMRKFFEAHVSLPIIACYKEDERAIRTIIFQKFKSLGINVETDAMNYLATNLGEDKQITLNEIEKILTYLGTQKSLSYGEVIQLLADSSELTLNDITGALSTRDAAKLEKSLRRAFAENVNAVPILRSVQWQLQRLITLKMMLANGMSLDAAFNAIRPQVYKMQQEQMRVALRKWSEVQLKTALSAITKTEFDAKASTIDPDIICRDALLKLAIAA